MILIGIYGTQLDMNTFFPLWDSLIAVRRRTSPLQQCRTQKYSSIFIRSTPWDKITVDHVIGVSTDFTDLQRWHQSLSVSVGPIKSQPAITCSKLTIETLFWRRSGVFIINFEHILHPPCSSVFFVNFEQVNASWNGWPAEVRWVLFLLLKNCWMF